MIPGGFVWCWLFGHAAFEDCWFSGFRHYHCRRCGHQPNMRISEARKFEWVAPAPKGEEPTR